MTAKTKTDTPLMIAGRAFGSRLLVGTGKFSSARVMKGALRASGTEIVTVALRRVDLDDSQGQHSERPGHEPLPAASQHLRGEECGGGRAAWRGSRAPQGCELGEAGDHARSPLSPARPDRDAQGRGDPGEGGIHRAALHQRRSGARQAASRCRHRDRHAAGVAHRFATRASTRASRSRSSSSRLLCRSWWMPASARRPTRRRRWKWARTLSLSTRPSPWPAIRRHGPGLQESGRGGARGLSRRPRPPAAKRRRHPVRSRAF